MDAVVDSVELLETVLLELDMTTLLVSAQRVSKHWHAIIAHSPRLQQALFFRPAGPRGSEHSPPVINDLLSRKFGKFFFQVDEDFTYLHRSSAFSKLPWATNALNPLPVTVFGPSRYPAWTAGSPQTEDSRRIFRRRNASWRRMLVSQPPPPVLGFSWLDLGDGQELQLGVLDPQIHQSSRTGSHGNGVRMGMLYDLIQHRLTHHTRNSVWFRVTWHQPRGPFVTSVCLRGSHKLAQQTHAIVEFVHHSTLPALLEIHLM